MVPEGWQEGELGDQSIAIIDGDRGANYPSAGDFYTDEYCLFLSAKNVTKNGFVFDEMQFINREKHEVLRKGKLGRGDIVVTTRGTVGNIAHYTEFTPYEVIRINSGMVLVRNTDDEIDTNYLHTLFRSFVIQNQFRRMTFGSAQPQLTVGILKKLSLPLPPLPEQKKIAEILSTWDRAIEVTEKLLENATRQKRALMQQLLTDKRRFPGFEGSEWREVKLGEVAEILMGSSPKSEAYNSNNTGLPLIQGNADIKKGRSMPRVFTSEVTRTCAIGDILLSVRAPVGTIAVSDHDACVGRGMAVVRPKKNTSAKWLLQFLYSAEPLWRRYSQGSTFEAINSKDIRSVSVKIPTDLAEQEAIGMSLERADMVVSLHQDQIGKLKSEKKALMQQLLTGKKRVKV